MEALELSAVRLPERAAEGALLVAVAVGAPVGRSFALHVQVRCVHRVPLHIRPHRVHLVRAVALAHEVVVHKISIASLELVALVDLLGGALDLRRLVRHGVRGVHGLPQVLALACGPRVLLLGRPAGGAGETISELIVLLLLLIVVVDVLRGVDGVDLGVADQLVEALRAGVVLGLVDVAAAQILAIVLHRHPVGMVVPKLERLLLPATGLLLRAVDAELLAALALLPLQVLLTVLHKLWIII